MKLRSAVSDLFPKGEKAQGSQLKALKPHRNSYDCHAPQAPGQTPAEAADTAAEDKPQNISQTSHRFISPFFPSAFTLLPASL